MKRFSIICLAAVFIMVASAHVYAEQNAANVRGKWQASWEGRLGSQPIILNLKQHGRKLSGRLLRTSGAVPLTGTIEGNAISFTVNFAGPKPYTILFKGSVDGDSIKGTSQAQNVGDRGAYLGHGGEIVQPDRPWTAVREHVDPQQTAKSIQ